ncbi:MAG TPA: P-loop NTPase fold protein [Thermoanaerobaculia bacterium]
MQQPELFGVAASESLFPVLQRAWAVQRFRQRESLSRSSIFHAAATMDVLVRSVLDACGFRIRDFERELRLASSAEYSPEGEPPPASAFGPLEGMFSAYASLFTERPLDALGLCSVLLQHADVDAPVFERLRAASLDVSRARRRLHELTESSNPPWARTDNLPYMVSPQLHALLDYAAHFARERRLGGITSSSMLLSAALFTGKIEGTSLAFLHDYFAHTNASELLHKWFEPFGGTHDWESAGTLPFVAMYESAYAIARRSSARGAIAARHFVGAMIAQAQLPIPTGARALLHELDVDPAALAKAYLNYLERNALGDRPDKLSAWREFLGVRDDDFMPSFHAEATDGPDLLDVSEDVDAFATLIASRKLSPPLSIGLFGDWGSGKSFFMKRVQTAVAERASRKQPDFYERIVQIEFNAWHYVEANLWASLTEHIFRNLRLTTEPPGMTAEKRREHLLTKLDEEIAKRNAAQLRLEHAESARDRAANVLDAKKKAADATAGMLPSVSAKDAWDLVKLDPDVQETLKSTLSQLGVPAAVESKEDLRKTLDDLRRSGSRARLLAAWIAKQPRVLMLLAVLLVLAPFGIAAVAQLLKPYLPALAATVAQVTAVVATVTGWIARQVKRANPLLQQLEDVRVRIDRLVEKAEATRRVDVTLAEAEVQRAKDEVVAAKGVLEESEREVLAAQQELDDLTAGRQLARFIDDRSASDDYRKLLGVLATVRDDFQKLSVLLDRSVQERAEDAADKELYGLDRIILYIDDLDRCHPARVVEVLQAVHLLLAFKLFVVVVGVDARWVSESLRQKHRTLWGGRSSVPGYAVQPHDYLEKIFQVPFWLEPMQPATTATYIRNLLMEDIAPEDDPQRPPQPRARGGVHANGGAAAHGGSQSSGGHAAATSIDDAPKQLALRDREVEYMESDPIAELVGRSPRTAKRFVNTYRFFRAGVPARRIEEFVAETGVPEYKRVLLLLAIVVGAPDVSVEVFSELRKADAQTTLADFAAALRTKVPSPRHAKEWEGAAAALESLDARCGHLLDLLPKVARYSFRPPFAQAAPRPSPIGPLLPVRRAAPAGKKKGGPKAAVVPRDAG